MRAVGAALCAPRGGAMSGQQARGVAFLGISYHTLVAYLKDPREVMGAETPASIGDGVEEAAMATAAACPEPVEV